VAVGFDGEPVLAGSQVRQAEMAIGFSNCRSRSDGVTGKADLRPGDGSTGGVMQNSLPDRRGRGLVAERSAAADSKKSVLAMQP